MMTERGHIFGCLMVGVLLLAGCLIMADSTTGMLAADLTLDFSVSEQHAEIDPDEAATVQYRGTVTAKVVSLPAGQLMEIWLRLENEDIDHEFDPGYFLVTQESVGEELPFVLNVNVDTGIQSGQNILEAYAFYSYSPGIMGGSSNISKLVLLVDEYKDGRVECPETIGVDEGSMGTIEVEVINTGNAWTEYDLLVEGTSRAETSGILVETQKVHHFGLHFATSEELPVSIYVEDIDGDTSIMLTFTLFDHESSMEYSSCPVMIKAMEKGGSPDTDRPIDDGDAGPVDGSEKDSEDPIVPDEGDEDNPEGPIMEGSTSFAGAWFVIPAALLLMLHGIGSYLYISTRKRGKNG